MPTMDIFNNDAFSVQSLTASINNPPEGEVVPTMVDALFQEEGITTTVCSIERDNDKLALVPAAERGAPGQPITVERRDLVPFNCLHLPQTGAVMADEVQGVRAFGSENELQMVERLVQRKLFKARKQLAATIAYHRIGAITGKVYDANGTTVLLDLFSRFGLTQQSVNFALGTTTTDVQQKIRDAKRKAEDAIASGGVITGWLGICGRGFYDAFVGHEKVKTAFDRWNDGAFLRDDLRGGFDFGQVIWKEYYGKVGTVEYVNTDTAYLVPVGVDDLFMTCFAPANYIETVNTLGLPFYAKQELMRMGKGVDLEAQSNPLNICTKPRAVIKLVKQ